MTGKLIAVGLFGVGGLAAASVGGYLALRSNAAGLRPAGVSEVAAPAVVPVTESPAQPGVAATPAPTDPSASRATTSLNAAAPRLPQMAARVVSRPEPAATPAVEPIAPDAPALPAAVPVTPPPPAPVPADVTPAPGQAPSPTSPRYTEVTVVADAVLGLRLESTISTETARVEDRVFARISRDVLVDGRVAIPAGARLEGTVTMVARGGKFKDRPRLGIAFQSLVLADNTRAAIQTDPIYRDGESPSGQANTKVGGSTVVGAILGAMIGGKKGAVLGGTAGAAGGAAAVAAGARAEAVLVSGSSLTVRLNAPVTVLIERNP